MFSHARICELAKSFVRKVQDLHIKITNQIQASNIQYKFQFDLY